MPIFPALLATSFYSTVLYSRPKAWCQLLPRLVYVYSTVQYVAYGSRLKQQCTRVCLQYSTAQLHATAAWASDRGTVQ